ncbi:Snaclec stejaggregin-A subunit alpha [Holothuria leucospilota]|uniref:Snaclec stejaggregin-A subunit alpha n=1 Tax=Holothuria leucospilota TaxID=206669 RepID=A0A9Q0YI52_HOLLE|nr:Snaclec stejaggregin-A subunit alpha [Holothuria leucospilota]
MASFRFTLLLSLVTLLGMCARTDASCPSNWEPNGAYCYRVYSQPMTFDGAEAFCVNEDSSAHLVSIHSESENTVVYDIFSSILPGTENRMWIGLNKPALGSNFEWSDTTTVSYLNWATGQPTQVSGDAAVVMIPPGNGVSSSEWEVATAGSVQDYFMCKKLA